MNKRQSYYLGIIFVAGGILSGVAALIISSVLPEALQQQNSIGAVLVFVMIEELAKLIVFWLIFKSFMLQKVLFTSDIVFNSSLGGFGFGLFEFFLITLGSSISTNALNPMMIHIMTAFILGFALSLHFKKNNILSLVMIALSVAIHLCYNMFVINNNF